MPQTKIEQVNAARQSPPVTVETAHHLDYLPVGLFGSVMGLTGLSVAWHLAASRYGLPGVVADLLTVLALLAFVAVSVGYLTKLIFAPDAVRAEFGHPIAGNLFGALLISLLLVPIVLAPLALWLAQILWIAGAVGMVGFAWLVVSRWMSNQQQFAHATPVWVVPVVGILDVPLALPSLALPPMHDLMVACVAIGLFFAVPLFTIVFARLLFNPPLPPALQPTLMILVAPFAVGFSSYITATGHVDPLAQSLYWLTLFILAVLLGRLRLLALCCPFRVSWWAVSFPLAATAITAIRFAQSDPGLITDIIALTLLSLASVVITGLLFRTLLGIARGELRHLSG